MRCFDCGGYYGSLSLKMLMERKSIMKRLFILLFVFAFVSIASDARAQTVLPGCDDESYDIPENFGRSMIVRDQAVAREVLPRTDSPLAMTFSDHL